MKSDLMSLATYERSCLETSLQALRSEVGDITMEKIQLFVDVTNLYGGIYVARDIASRVTKQIENTLNWGHLSLRSKGCTTPMLFSMDFIVKSENGNVSSNWDSNSSSRMCSAVAAKVAHEPKKHSTSKSNVQREDILSLP